jgi:hypothetical protein
MLMVMDSSQNFVGILIESGGAAIEAEVQPGTDFTNKLQAKHF